MRTTHRPERNVMKDTTLRTALLLCSSEYQIDTISENTGLKILELLGPSEETDELIETLAGYKLALYWMNEALEAEKKKTLFRRLIDKIK